MPPPKIAGQQHVRQHPLCHSCAQHPAAARALSTHLERHPRMPLEPAAVQIWVDCAKIVQDLLKNQQTKIYFGEPVKESYVPNYYSVIKNPMDLGTIKSARCCPPCLHPGGGGSWPPAGCVAAGCCWIS